MTKNIGLYIAILLSILLSGCIKKIVSNGNIGIYDGERIAINAHIPSSRSAVVEDHIQTVRMVVFNQDGELVSNDLVQNVVVVSDGVSFSTKMARGINNVYIICNETVELNTQLIAITKESDVENITFQPALTTTQIPMYGKVIRAFVTANRDGSNVQVAINGVISNSLKIDVDRLLAKLSITMIKNIVDPDVDFTVDNIVVTVNRAPKQTPLKPGVVYTRSDWADNVLYAGTGALANNGAYVVVAEKYTLDNSIDRVKFPNIYLAEHLLQNEEKEKDATFLLVDMTYRMNKGNIAQAHSTYIIPIGQAPPINHNITRNHHYDLYVTIKGLGSTGIYAEIVPFTEYHHPVEWKPFEGYTLVSERAAEYGQNTNVWNDYSQYSAILKIAKNKVITPALFRYGSLTAIREGATAGAFNVTADVLWQGNLPAITTWGEINYQNSGDILHTVESVALGRGDPCRLVGLTLEEIKNNVIDNQLWRMPTIEEMEWLNTARNDEIKTEGFYSFRSLITPKNGYRTDAGVMTPSVAQGRYWSGSDAKSFVFSTADNTKTSSAVDDPKFAYGIRCIRTIRHDSRFTIAGAITSWIGATDILSRISDAFLVPFWRVVPVDPTAIGITHTLTQGGSGTSGALATVASLPNPYVGRSFKLMAYGYGIDGVVHTSEIEIIQAKLTHSIVVDLVTTGLSIENGFLRIPQEGATLTFKATLSPALHSPYLLSTLKWRVIGSWYNNQWNTAQGDEVLITEESTVTFPANNWGHIISAVASFGWVTPIADRPPDNTYTEVRFIQER